MDEHLFGLPFLNISYGQDTQLRQELIIDNEPSVPWPGTHKRGPYMMNNGFWNLDIHTQTGVVDGYTTEQALYSPSTCQPMTLDRVTTIGGAIDHDLLYAQKTFLANLPLDGSCSDITNVLSPVSTSTSDTKSPLNLSGGTQAMFGNSDSWTAMPIGLSAEGVACSICRKPFTRRQGAEACQNKHLHQKPHPCKGICGKNKCTAEFSSRANLMRHCRVFERRYKHCEYCNTRVLRQNIARHRNACIAKF